MSESRGKKGIVYVILGGSGSGKSTVSRKLCERYADMIAPIYFTTRVQRPNEIEGVDYNFVTKEAFEELVRSGRCKYTYLCHGNMYGIPVEIDEMIAKGMSVILGLSRKLLANVKYDYSSVKLIYIDVDKSEEAVRMKRRDPHILEEDMETRLTANGDIREWARENKEMIDLFVPADMSIEEMADQISLLYEENRRGK